MSAIQHSPIGQTINGCDILSSLLDLDRFQTDCEVAKLLHLDVQTVRHWRLVGTGPKYVKIGRSVRYAPRDIAAYLESLPGGGGRCAAQA